MEQRHNAYISTMAPAMLTSRYLELILFPTEQCNFRCTYCYEDFSIGKMKPDVINGIKNLMTRRAEGLDHLKLTWFGGEPLSAKEIVLDICQHALALSRQYSFRYESSMTTNGFMLNFNAAKKLIEHGVSHYQISFDGYKNGHDVTRQRIDGSGTFERIWNNLIVLKNSDLDFNITLRLHVTPQNEDSLIALIESMKNELGGDRRFTIFFKAIANLGGPNSNTFAVLRRDDRGKVMQRLIEAVDDKISIVQMKHTQFPEVCYAAHANSFIIRADGSIGKCTVALSSSSNKIGAIQSDGQLNIDIKRLQPWLKGIHNQQPESLRCPLNTLTS